MQISYALILFLTCQVVIIATCDGQATSATEDADYYKNIAKNFQSKLSIKNRKHAHVLSKVKGNYENFHQAVEAADSGSIIRAAPKKKRTEKQVLFLHFHKAGGTSICRYFKDSGWRVPKRFCICDEKVTTHALFAHTRKVIHMRNLDKMFQKSQADICMLEKKWIRPFYFFQIRNKFSGSIMTALRVPWDRFRSNYEKDYSICSDQNQKKNNKLSKMTIATYATLNPRDCPKSYYLRTNTNRPNFYIRMLNGLSIEQYSFDGEGVGGLPAMTVDHLEQAKQVLLAFDVILFLEEDSHSQNVKLQRLTGSNQNLTQRSNNPFSSAHSHISNKTTLTNKAKRREVLGREILPPTDYYREQFEKDNHLDILLYQWAFEHFSGI